MNDRPANTDANSTTGRVTRKPFVRVQQVTKVYPTRVGFIHAVDEVSFDIGEHEFLSIVGPSGCGKSTLLMMISGLLHSSDGEISIQGKRIDRPYNDLGIVFQQDVLLDWRNVLQNVMLQCEIRGLDKKQYVPRALSLLGLVGLKGFENKLPSELSGGMRQRVSICRALVHDAPLLLMDEPFGALDALTRDQMNIDLLRIWDQDRKTVLFITHSIPEAIFLSDRVIVMSPRPGTIEEIIDIDLPRPRHLELRDAPEFGSYNRRIRQIFQAVGVLTAD
jgi:NitT/TauT family transport system ATP-binding protein